ncbi:hypothetical protein HK100_005154 [Physocladia obscura]|uniref:Uncharacterized protein n=1 Tax=Physocladia obscura TaxID=109957 RepID=A0AAD5T8J3_9FUNG|nr:hypothetical protein HK100_005154 [Physocladia obscura]
MLNATCPTPPDSGHHLSTSNVAIGFTLILVNAGISSFLGLGISAQLFVAAFRCVVQLNLLGLVLKPVFDNDSWILVSCLSLGMATISALEITFNKTKARHYYMLPSVWICVVVSVFVASFLVNLTNPQNKLGNAFAIQADPWFSARQYIPILGMLLGNSLSTIALGLNSCLTQLENHKDRIEMDLSFGASRWEAIDPIARAAIQVALLPTITQMSVMGLISIPGMMTGQILGGANIDDAVRYQQIILFMITAASSLAVTSSCLVCLFVCVDAECRLRLDRIIKPVKYSGPWSVGRFINGISNCLCPCFSSRREGTEDERRPLVLNA